MLLRYIQTISQLMETPFFRQPLVLRPGQVVRGQIVEQLGNGDVIVKIDGQRLRATAEASLSAERYYWFQIHSDRDRLVLKVVQRDGDVIQNGRQMAEAMLRHLDLKLTNENRRAVEWLWRLNGPLTRQNVEQLASMFRTFGQTPVLERALSLAISKNLPLQSSIVQAIAHAVSGEGLVRRLGDLAQQLKQWMQDDFTIPAFVKERVQQVVKQLEGALAADGSRQNGRPNFPGDQTRGDVRQQPVNLPAPTERGVLASALREAASLQGNGQRLPDGAGPLSKATRTAGETVRPVSPLSSQGGRQPELQPETEQPAVNINRPPQVSSTPQDQLSPLRWWASGDPTGQTFKSVFHKWLRVIGADREQQLLQNWRLSQSVDTFKAVEQNNVKEGVIRLLQLPLPSYVRERADAVLQHITGQQLLLSTSHDNQWQHLLLYVPTPHFRGREAAVHVFTRKRAGGTLDQDNCRLLFQLELDRLGWSCLVVHVVNRAVSVEWYCDDDHLPQQLEKAEPFLRERLKMAGYTLSHGNARQGEELETKRQQSVWPTVVNWGKGVDMRV